MTKPLTGRGKLEAAMSEQGTPQVPALICYTGIFIRDHWGELTRHPWWLEHSPRLEDQLAWRSDQIRAIGQDWYRVPHCPPRDERGVTILETTADGVFKVNRRTGERTRLEPPVVSGTATLNRKAGAEPIDSREQIDARVPVEPISIAAVRADGRDELAKAVERAFPDLAPCGYVASPLWRCGGLWGFEDFMHMTLAKPKLVAYACERFLAATREVVRLEAALGARVMWIEECFTDMIHPKAFAKLNVPAMRELVAAIREAGMKSIYYYCGSPWDRLEYILAVGADAVSFEEGKKGFRIDIEDVIDRVRGRCTVLGNLDAVGILEKGSDEAVASEIRRQLAAGRRNGRRFAMSLGSPVTPGTPAARVRRYCDLVHEFGTY